MLKVESELTKLRASLVAIRPPKGQKTSFDLQAEIKPVSRDGTKLKLRYSIGLETFPLIYRAEMEGTATINTELFAKDENLEDLGEEVIGDLALQIFRRNYESLFLTLTSLELEAPSPWVIRDVHSAS